MIPKKAQCVLQEASAGGSVGGTIMFERMEDDDDSIMVTGAVSGRTTADAANGVETKPSKSANLTLQIF